MMSKGGSNPLSIITTIQQEFPNQNFCNRTIYNYRYKLRKDFVNDRSPINVLFDELYNTNSFISTFDVDENGKLKNFLIGISKRGNFIFQSIAPKSYRSSG